MRNRLLLLFCLLPLAFSSLGNSSAKANEPPNILLVVVDDLGWADLGCYGADLHQTPNIDRFATESVRFTDAYAAAPICTPSRASIMTGKFPARLHMTIWREMALNGGVIRRGMRTAAAEPNLPHAEITIAEALREAGYYTAHLGKWHLGGADFYPETHGFDLNIGASIWGAPPSFFYPYRGNYKQSEEYRYVPRLEWGQEGEYLTDRLTDEAIKTIKQVKDQPFFIHLAYHTVHTPIEGKPEVVKRYEQKIRPELHHQNAQYAAMVHSLDENFGRLLSVLKKRKLEDSTVVIFISDNGGYVNNYDKQTVTSNHPLRSGKGSLYEGGIRVPLIIRTPDLAKAEVCETPVISNDLYSTCLELAGTTGQENDGLSILPLLKNPQQELDRDELFFHFPHFYTTTTPVSAIREGDMKLIHYYMDDRDELYDLSNDLAEANDLSESHQEVKNRLRSRLEEWLQAVDAQIPVHATEESK
ncbi:N-acetylgalactosamine-6-sulfatase [Planctomycetales bacterium 10988]|nr:N-acetylgalactosamine-6-sulfatase [Planctomycetales bacterium 10988]